MKLCITLILVGLLTLTTTDTLAAESGVDLPEAYAGLNKNAYHPISFNNNKSDGFSFKLDDKQITIDLK